MRLHLPRLPVLGWSTFAGRKRAPFASILDQSNLRFTTSGRAAIALSLRMIGVTSGDRVLVPTYHCPTMIAPVAAVGAIPVFFAIDESGAPLLRALDGSRLSNVRAMIAAHYFGLPQPMAAIRNICDERGIALVEDCAHSMFGEIEGKPVGSWGDYAIASLTKFFPVTDGGCVASTTRNIDFRPTRGQGFAREIKSIANALELGAESGRLSGMNGAISTLFRASNRLRGMRPNRAPAIQGTSELDTGMHKWLVQYMLDDPFRPASKWAEWIARVAHRERIVALRRRNYAHLAALLHGLRGARALQPELPPLAAPYVFPLWVDDPERHYQRVRALGIPVFRWDEVWPGTPALEGDCGLGWATHVFQLGCHQDLELRDLERMAEALRAILG